MADDPANFVEACGYEYASRDSQSQLNLEKQHVVLPSNPPHLRRTVSNHKSNPVLSNMPVDYSKWDALELSDDSDVEVHPNVDKRSFIRAKQNQIHQQRFDRKHRITTLKYERVVNDGLLLRIDALLKSLNEHKKDVEGKNEASDVDEVVFDALMDVSNDGSLGVDQPPRPPEGVHTKEDQPSYSKMMGALVDQVKAEVDKSKSAEGSARYEAYLKEVDGHKKKVQGLQKRSKYGAHEAREGRGEQNHV